MSKIYQAINGVMAEIGAISKNKKNSGQGFMYRSIDDVMNALQPALINQKLCIVPEILEDRSSERMSKSGSITKYTELKMKYTFFADDGSFVTAIVKGEAMDTGDKGANKAMSIAYKYACFQVFCIPTEEMIDTDSESQKLEKKAEKAVAKTAKGDVITAEKENKNARKEEITKLIDGTGLTIKSIQEWCLQKFSVAEISKLTDEQYEYMIAALQKQLNETA